MMTFQSLIESAGSKRLVEIEVSLLPGMPQTHFIGLPDSAMRESVTRLRAAFRAAGFQWPSRHQLLINLKPAYVRKSSQGLDLALALAILNQTGQLDPGFFGQLPLNTTSKIVAYAELGLQGEVITPSDASRLPLDEMTDAVLIMGEQKGVLPVDSWSLDHLKNYLRLRLQRKVCHQELLTPPQSCELSFPEPAARALEIVAHGEHSVMLAGPAGSGKSTFAESIHALLEPPHEKLYWQARQWACHFGEELSWRPFVQPHHSASALAIIGGGYPPCPGAMTQAHGGVLLLDEYLEFDSKVQEALREPVEKGSITISRRGVSQDFPAQFQLVATTNLCPCGDLVPGVAQSCGRSLRRCRSHLDRLSGPMLDRFDLLVYSHTWKQNGSCNRLSQADLKKRLAEVQDFFKKSRPDQAESHRPNGRLTFAELENQLSKKAKELRHLFEHNSQRRTRALLRVARTLSDIRQESHISVEALNEAFDWVASPFYQLRQAFM